MCLVTLQGSSRRFRTVRRKTSFFFRMKFKLQMTRSLLLKWQKLQMINPSKHHNRQAHQGGERRVLPRSICTMTNEEKRMKMTNHEKNEIWENLWGTVINILGDQRNMEFQRNMNFGERLNLFWGTSRTTVNFYREQGNMHPPPAPLTQGGPLSCNPWIWLAKDFCKWQEVVRFL